MVSSSDLVDLGRKNDSFEPKNLIDLSSIHKSYLTHVEITHIKLISLFELSGAPESSRFGPIHCEYKCRPESRHFFKSEPLMENTEPSNNNIFFLYIPAKFNTRPRIQ